MTSNNYRQNPQYYPSSPPTRYASPTLSEQGSFRSMGSPPPAYQQPYPIGYNNNNRQVCSNDGCSSINLAFSYLKKIFVCTAESTNKS
jgi:hypothetical protein